MRVFVLGASGFIGSAVVKQLLDHGHSVLGLARSDAAAASVGMLGATVLRGSLEHLESLRRGVAEADGVIHLGFNHDFSRFMENCALDRRAIDAIGAALAGSQRPLLTTSGVAHLAPSVHGMGDHGFVPMLAAMAREKGVSAYIGEGTNRWPAVHRFDAARLYQLALEQGEIGARYHAIGEEGVSFRAIAEAIGAALGLPVRSVTEEDAAAHFGWFARFAGADMPASGEQTRRVLGWAPKEKGLIEDVKTAGYL